MLTVGRPGDDGRSRSDVKPLWVTLALLTTAIAAPAYAETPKAERGETLTVWNRAIVVFRATVREMRPTERAALAAQPAVRPSGRLGRWRLAARQRPCAAQNASLRARWLVGGES